MTTFREEIPALADALEGRPPGEILAAVAPRFPRWIALAATLGAEDCVLVDVIARERLRIEIFTVDTGFLFPETRALRRRLEERYGVAVRAVKPGVPPFEICPPAWQRDPDACCAARKVAPLRATLAEMGAFVTGIRRDETPDRAPARTVEWDHRFGLARVNPLVSWTADDVWAYVRRFEVPTSPLHARGYAGIGCAPCTAPTGPGEDPRPGRGRNGPGHGPRGRPVALRVT